jgi:hypothetical protein
MPAKKKSSDTSSNNKETTKPPPKKRGRKPKGGKIVKEPEEKKEIFIEKKSVILHLKCRLSDSNEYDKSHMKYDPNIINFEPYSENTNFETIQKDVLQQTETKQKVDGNTQKSTTTDKENEENVKMKKTIDMKLKELERELNLNDIQRKSACFWCTCDYNSPPIYIPSTYYKNKYNVYGSFCSPECACSFLFNEEIDDITKYERYQLLNFLYGSLYNYKKSIKPAPSPFYTLEKFYGNLSIQEYRKLLEYDRLLLVIDKPLTKIYPEIHEDNNEFETIYENKITLKKNVKAKKNDILNKVFGN